MMKISHFTDERIAEIYGGSPLTPEERAFLIADASTSQECSLSQAELAAMSDVDLVREARSVWVDYAAYM